MIEFTQEELKLIKDYLEERQFELLKLHSFDRVLSNDVIKLNNLLDDILNKIESNV